MNPAEAELMRFRSTASLSSLSLLADRASELFDLLSKGHAAMGRAEFERCSEFLAQLSGDFDIPSEDTFVRIDQSHDGFIQRDEFVEEVMRIAELVGARATLDAVGEVSNRAVDDEPETNGSDPTAPLPEQAPENESSAEEGEPLPEATKDEDLTSSTSEDEAPAEEEEAVAALPPHQSGATTADGHGGEGVDDILQQPDEDADALQVERPGEVGEDARPASSMVGRGSDVPKASSKKAKGKKKREDGPTVTKGGKVRKPKAPSSAGPATPMPVPASPSPAPSPSPTRRPRPRDGEGVTLQKTLEFGKPIRNAICIGREVWTADWQGNVSVRDREDASKVLGEIPTNRFVWCMLHVKPGLMLMGQEAHGICVFDSKKQEQKDTLTGGHTGGITCLAVDDAGDDDPEYAFPQRKIWSGSNDFTIRQWWVETWRTKGGAPTVPLRPDQEGTFTMDVGAWQVAIVRGASLYGHKNGVRALLKIGPELWSGSDDGTVRIWRCSDGECTEIVQDAHQGTVSRLAIVRSSVWSAGSDGVVKEWSIGGKRRQLLRKYAPAGCEKGIYALLPLGHDVWVCGHHPAIQVLSQHAMQLTSEEDGHKPYVSNLIGVDRVETKVVWSTSFGDRKLKVWKHTIRGEEASVDELKAANLLYEQQQQANDARLSEYLRKLESMQSERDRALETEAYVERARRIEEVLKSLGLANLLDNPEELGRMMRSYLGTKDVLERCGLAGALEDPALLEAVLLRYNGIKDSFERHGLPELFEDPHALDRFLGGHCAVRAEFQASGLEPVLNSAEAAQVFLEKHAKDQLMLQELAAALDESVQKASLLERELAGIAEELSAARGEGNALEAQRQRLEQELDSLRKVFAHAGLSHLLDDPEALKAFVERAAELERHLQELGLDSLLEDPGELARMIDTAQKLQEVLERCGFGSLLDNPEELEAILNRYEAIRQAFLQSGFTDLFQDPSKLAEIMSRYAALREAFQEFGFMDQFEEPDLLKYYLKTNRRLREEFGKINKEYLMDSIPSMRDFINEFTDMKQELVALRQKAARLKTLEEQLASGNAQLSQLSGDAAELRARLSSFEALGDLDCLRQYKEDSEELARMRRIHNKLQNKLYDLERDLEEKERERQAALERERLMAVKYKELDIFKLDIIARELKGIDNDLGMVGSEAKTLINRSEKLRNYDEQQAVAHASEKMLDACKALRAHLRDVIHKCLTETQKMHIGVAIEDHMAAGDLQDGGVMVVASYEEVERPDHGNSRAAKLRQDDEMRQHRLAFR